MFELLAPVFAVAGGLLAGVPLILHLFRRTPSVKMPFSVVRFLTPSLPTTTRRSKLEHWPLMLLRMLAVALIALAFARPFQRLSINREESAGSADRIAVLIDASASMRRDGLREAVTEEIKKLAASLKDQDTVSIAAYSETSRFLVTAEEWKQTEPAGRAAYGRQCQPHVLSGDDSFRDPPDDMHDHDRAVLGNRPLYGHAASDDGHAGVDPGGIG